MRGSRIAAEVAEHLDYLTEVAAELAVSDPVRERFEQAVGRAEDMKEAAEVWRRTADRVEKAARDVAGKLGGIDSSWQGADADAFLAHMQDAGLAGNDLVDAMRALAAALDHTAETVDELLTDIGDTIAETADSVSQALVVPHEGDQRARKYLSDLDGPAEELFSSVEDAFRAFARFCDELGSGKAIGDVRFDKRMPEGNWDFQAPAAPPAPAASPAAPPAPAPPAPAPPEPAPGGGGGGGAADSGGGAGAAAPPAAAEAPDLAPGGATGAAEPSATPPAAAAPVAGAAGGAAAAATGGMMGGMMPMGPMAGMMGGGAQDRQNQSRLKTKPEDLFGTPEAVPPAVIGEDPKQKAPEPKDNTAQPRRTGSAGVGDAAPPVI
ncbi:WXG100 family type VII secretion target [Saccharopolyspora taberi]|uniref:WXG100 family type VII secretion target n=1 Tax=Saccharopolyspora taberi TaxID=60895 RepID=A0ABN3VJ35_9PSEU